MFRVLVIVLVLIGGAAHAQQVAALYVVRALGLKVGEFALTGSVDERRYAVSASFVTTGLVGAVAGMRFLIKADGSRSGARFMPRRYTEEMDTGERESRADLRFSRGVAKASGSQIGDRGPYAVTDAEQRGALDPLTGLLLVVRDLPRDEVCQLNEKIFDGERLTRLILTQRRDVGDKVVCKGTFQRIGGYSPEALAKKRAFALTVTYVPVGNVMHAARVDADTIYGRASIVRD